MKSQDKIAIAIAVMIAPLLVGVSVMMPSLEEAKNYVTQGLLILPIIGLCIIALHLYVHSDDNAD